MATLRGLTPWMRAAVPRLIGSVQAAGYKVVLYSAKRSWAQQASRYAAGHTTVPPGRSKHEKGRAVDLIITPDDGNGYKLAGEIWTDLGGLWGGNFKDRALAAVEFQHFEDSEQQLQLPSRSRATTRRRAGTKSRVSGSRSTTRTQRQRTVSKSAIVAAQLWRLKRGR